MLKCPSYLPSRREIRDACANIRQNWTAAERRRRAVTAAVSGYETTWMPPQIFTANCMSRVRKIVMDASA